MIFDTALSVSLHSMATCALARPRSFGMHVFLSYCSADTEITEKGILEAEGIDEEVDRSASVVPLASI